MGVVVGGFVFRAVHPDTLRVWYAEHLGAGAHGEWATTAGPSWDMPGVDGDDTAGDS